MLNKFYVYYLKDPRNGEIFYIGKGSGKRVLRHEKEAYTYHCANPRKVSRIEEIKEAGMKLEHGYFQKNLSECDAFDLERNLISKYRSQLTNHMSGVSTRKERARHMLTRLKPFDSWVKETRPSSLHIEYYWIVRKELEDLAVNGQEGY